MPADASLTVEYLRGIPQPSALPKSGIPQPSAFAMVEERIFEDPALQRLDISVYGLLACARRGVFASVGERRLAKRLRARRRSIQGSIARLIAAGYVKLSTPTQSGCRARYELTSTLFTAKAAKPALRSKRSRLSPTVRAARAFAQNRDERERELTA